jgi:outer membrane protein assembly factor BamD
MNSHAVLKSATALMTNNLSRMLFLCQQLKPVTGKRYPYVTGCFVALAVMGCGASVDKGIEPPAVELRSDSAALSTEAPEGELAQLSKRLYQASMYTVARDSLNSLKERYPLGPYATFSELKYADTFYYNGEFVDAAIHYDSFLRNHPTSPEASYAKLQAARSHMHAAKTDGRDRTPWQRALTLYDEIIKAHPNSPLATTAHTERAHVVAKLKEYDLEIIKFYQNLGNKRAVEARKHVFKRTWPEEHTETNNPIIPPVSQRLADNVSSKRLSTRTIGAPRTIGEPHTVAGTKSLPSKPTSQREPLYALPRIKRIACGSKPAPHMTIELTHLPENASDLNLHPRALSPQLETVHLDSIRLSSEQKTWSCLSENDVLLSDVGVLQIAHSGKWILTAMKNPPRLIAVNQ